MFLPPASYSRHYHFCYLKCYFIFNYLIRCKKRLKAVWKVETRESEHWGEVYWNTGFPGGSGGKESTCNMGDPTHSSILAWRISWTEKPGRRQSMGSQRVGQGQHFHFHLLGHGAPLEEKQSNSAAGNTSKRQSPFICKTLKTHTSVRQMCGRLVPSEVGFHTGSLSKARHPPAQTEPVDPATVSS